MNNPLLDILNRFCSWDDVPKLIPEYAEKYSTGKRVKPIFSVDEDTGALSIRMKDCETGPLIYQSEACHVVEEAFKKGFVLGKEHMPEEQKRDFINNLSYKFCQTFWGTSSQEIMSKAVAEFLTKEMGGIL